jgi:hypothetical protein
MNDNTGATFPLSSQMKLYPEFERVELVGPSSNEPLENDEALKEWVWQNCKDSLLASMSIKFEEKEEPEEEKILKKQQQQRLDLLDTIAEVQRKYLEIEEVRPVHFVLIHLLVRCFNLFSD